MARRKSQRSQKITKTKKTRKTLLIQTLVQKMVKTKSLMKKTTRILT